MAENKAVLNKGNLEDFKGWLSANKIEFQEGSGSFKVMQIKAPSGWQSIFEKANQPGQYVVNKYLAPLVRDYVSARSVHGNKQEAA